MNKIILFITFLFAFFLESEAQTHFFDIFDMSQFNAQVKSVDEFILRFNGKERRIDVDAQYSDRESNILLLFNLSQFKSKKDSLFLNAQSFAESVVKDGVFINYEDSCWYAKVKCNGNLGGENVEFYLYLIVQQRGTFLYKWAIANAEGDVFKSSRFRRHQELYMSPNDHEQGFISLSRVVNEAYRYIDDYAISGYMTDELSVFLSLVRCGLLKINYVSDVEFVFLQVPEYKFSVKLFQRESKNAGWLINSVSKCKTNEKDKILYSLYHKLNDSDIEPNEFSGLESRKDTISTPIQYIYMEDDNKPHPTTGEKIVGRFYKILGLWLETCDCDYQKKLVSVCAGKKGKDCFVSDNLMNYFSNKTEQYSDTTYNFKLYLRGFESLINNGNINLSVTDIKQIESNDNFYVVSCNMILSGDFSYNS